MGFTIYEMGWFVLGGAFDETIFVNGVAQLINMSDSAVHVVDVKRRATDIVIFRIESPEGSVCPRALSSSSDAFTVFRYHSPCFGCSVEWQSRGHLGHAFPIVFDTHDPVSTRSTASCRLVA
jgi:hypothetical protein